MSSQQNSYQDIVNFILDNVAKLCKQPRDILSEDTLLATVGVDSLNAVLLCGKIEDEFELEIEPIVMFQYKTAKDVANALINMNQK
ncbi:acyl carrier protein [uncultured Alteromonas sp.]|uniref:acyl carrier protein n=1 Tax=uncultured Alteromonas sp. TaxID=179113 RepID=UPI0026002ACC|nr:acyl carrier protein [uncultured Alteromonas sp.]